jgi:hypothetical protein
MNLKNNPFRFLSGVHFKPSMIFGLIILTALFAFEIFNYSTTDYALRDLLGELRFANIRWSTILAFAFCGIDFAGIARLFTPQQDSNEPKEVWYLFGAWLLAATMNALLTWWGVSMAIANHNVQSASVMNPGTMVKVVPIFVAIMVWIIRILIIGTISASADHLIWDGANAGVRSVRRRPSTSISPAVSTGSHPLSAQNSAASPANRPTFTRPMVTTPPSSIAGRPEPTYHSMSGNPTNSVNSNSTRQV